MKQTYQSWVNTNHIPEDVKRIVNSVLKEFGFAPAFESPDSDDPEDFYGNENIINLTNRGGYTYAYGKGFLMTYCTSSLLDGPGTDPKFIIDFKGSWFYN